MNIQDQISLFRFKEAQDGTVFGVMSSAKYGTYFTIENKDKLIPAGVYDVELTYSPKFKCKLPLLVNPALGVTAARGIRIHVGNRRAHSQGCILIGNGANLTAKCITDSATAIAQLTDAFVMNGPVQLVIYQ